MQANHLSTERYKIFNRTDVVACGWYWLMPSASLRRGMVRPATIIGYELAVYRGTDGKVAALDAFCPHMGAHLSEGKVVGNELRCFFHNWCFDSSGACTDIPCMEGKTKPTISTRAWHVSEMHGLIWVWLGPHEPTEGIPEPPELAGKEYESAVGNFFIKNCHPNVVMVNAIDEQHFRTVHNLPGHILTMDPAVVNGTHIDFRNVGSMPASHWVGRLLRPLYRNALTYEMNYYWGSTGTVTFGPDFLHLYLMFTLRLNAAGQAEGFAIVFTKKRKGPIGKLFNALILELTKIGGRYFALGDTRIFQTIRFDLRTPIAADRAVLAFIQHLEKQPPAQAPRLR